VPASTTDLGFQENGELVALNVKAGDMVGAGDVLARLEVDRTPAEQQADIASAELAVVLAQQSLDQLYENAELDAARALAALEDAQQALDEMYVIDTELASVWGEVVKAKEAIAEAEVQLALLNASPSEEAYDIAHASLLFKEKDLQELEAQVAQLGNKIKSAPNKTVRDRLKTQLVNLEIQLLDQQADYENALHRYNTMGDPADPLELSVFEARLATAQAQLKQALEGLEQTQAGPEGSAILMAEAQLAQAQDEWERLKDSPDPEDVALTEAELAKAQARLDLVRGEQLVLDLVAPLDATVLAVYAAVGDRTGNQPILSLADASQLQVEVFIDETDLANVQMGYEAVVIFDALPEMSFEGLVVAVAPSLKTSGSTQAVQALVLLEPASYPLNTLPIGLNTSVEIIAGQVENAVLVTLEALQRESGNNCFVYVIEGESIERRPVEVGLMDLTTAEITSGLAAGEVVATGHLDVDQE
jgi:multidrug efflux pump subunit AcrA (membrane-fusion protein)